MAKRLYEIDDMRNVSNKLVIMSFVIEAPRYFEVYTFENVHPLTVRFSRTLSGKEKENKK